MAAIDFRKEYKRTSLLRDVRTPMQKFRDSLLTKNGPLWWSALSSTAHLALPIIGPLISKAITNQAVVAQRQKGNPCSYPLSANKLDPHELDIGKVKKWMSNHPQEKEFPKSEARKPYYWKKGQGIFYCGNDRFTMKELNISSEQMRRHSFFMGTTGSGKTEFLLSVMFNSLIQGSSYIIIDGKGDIKLYHAALSQARIMGRENDVLLLNFLTGKQDIIGAQSVKISNRFNFFGSGSADSISQTLTSIAAGDDDIWGQRMASYVEALTKPLVFLRDKFKLPLDVTEYRYYFDLNELERLFLIRPFNYKGLDYTLSGVYAFFTTLPAWSVRKSRCYLEFIELMIKDEQRQHFFKRNYINLWNQIKDDLSEEFLAQHKNQDKQKQQGNGNNNDAINCGQGSDTELQFGYITMQLTRVFSSLADTYGYIMRTATPEVDMEDVILHRRIVVELLPALAKSPAELKNLGRISLAVIRSSMVVGLGYKPEGDADHVVETRPTNAPSPILIICDECGAYLIEGSFVLPAQGRSLGVSMGFAAQDITGLQRNIDKETDSVLANTVNKFCGKIDDTVTAEFFEKIGGEGKFAVATGFENKGASGGVRHYEESNNVSLETIKRITVQDLRSLTQGHWFYFFGDEIFYIDSFYANTRLIKNLRVNHFIGVKSFASAEGLAIKNVLSYIDDLFTQPLDNQQTLSADINELVSGINTTLTGQLNWGSLLGAFTQSLVIGNMAAATDYYHNFTKLKSIKSRAVRELQKGLVNKDEKVIANAKLNLSNFDNQLQPFSMPVSTLAFGSNAELAVMEHISPLAQDVPNEKLQRLQDYAKNKLKFNKNYEIQSLENRNYLVSDTHNQFYNLLKLFVLANQINHDQVQLNDYLNFSELSDFDVLSLMSNSNSALDEKGIGSKTNAQTAAISINNLTETIKGCTASIFLEAQSQLNTEMTDADFQKYSQNFTNAKGEVERELTVDIVLNTFNTLLNATGNSQNVFSEDFLTDI